MKLKRLDARGVAHHFILALIVVGIVTAFTFQAVAGHAQPIGPGDGPTTVTQTTTTQKTNKKDITNPANCKSTRPTLRYPQHNACVAKLQKAINDNQSGSLTVDGQFGKLTRSKVKEIQTANKLKVDGVVGKCTWRAIYHETLTAGCLASNAAKQGAVLVYCTYKTANNIVVSNKHISVAACSKLKGTATSKPVVQAGAVDDSAMAPTPVAVACKYYDIKGILQTATITTSCATYQYTHSYGKCVGTATGVQTTTQSACDALKKSTSSMTIKWYTFAAYKTLSPTT